VHARVRLRMNGGLERSFFVFFYSAFFLCSCLSLAIGTAAGIARRRWQWCVVIFLLPARALSAAAAATRFDNPGGGGLLLLLFSLQIQDRGSLVPLFLLAFFFSFPSRESEIIERRASSIAFFPFYRHLSSSSPHWPGEEASGR
jgi:hypothetical protein